MLPNSRAAAAYNYARADGRRVARLRIPANMNAQIVTVNAQHVEPEAREDVAAQGRTSDFTRQSEAVVSEPTPPPRAPSDPRAVLVVQGRPSKLGSGDGRRGRENR
jgi:hypothetical protein